MVPKSSAEWCKKYRQRNKEVHPEKENLQENIAKKGKLIQLLMKEVY